MAQPVCLSLSMASGRAVHHCFDWLHDDQHISSMSSANDSKHSENGQNCFSLERSLTPDRLRKYWERISSLDCREAPTRDRLRKTRRRLREGQTYRGRAKITQTTDSCYDIFLISTYRPYLLLSISLLRHRTRPLFPLHGYCRTPVSFEP